MKDTAFLMKDTAFFMEDTAFFMEDTAFFYGGHSFLKHLCPEDTQFSKHFSKPAI